VVAVSKVILNHILRMAEPFYHAATCTNELGVRSDSGAETFYGAQTCQTKVYRVVVVLRER
jgi:hypothetical protein